VSLITREEQPENRREANSEFVGRRIFLYPPIVVPMRYLLWTFFVSALLVAVTLASRPLLPVDETRYLSVAWEAYVTGDHLVSHLNTETYAHKPPLLFWLINAVWSLIGLNDPAARLVSPVAGIVCLILTAMMARRLWPDATSAHRCAPMVLASMSIWIVFCHVTMFDMLLTCFTLTALLGVLRAETGASATGWLITGVALGLGVLSKGPVVFVHVMPAILMAPWWSTRVRIRFVHWYLGCGMAVLAAAAIALSWALPSAVAGGKAYGDELLFGQTTGRMVNSFAHRQPFWWYLPWLPLCLLPWISLGSVWRGLRMTPLDSPLKFLLSWTGSSLLILSAVSGKQIYYLLPAIPAVALIMTRMTTILEGATEKRDLRFIIVGTIGMGVLPLIANHVPPLSDTRLRGLIADWYAIPLVACGMVLIPLKFKRIDALVFTVGTSALLFFIIVIASLTPTLWKGFDLRPLARMAASFGGDVAWYGGYHGQLNYLGQIQYVAEIHDHESLALWLNDQHGGTQGTVIMRLSAETVAEMKRLNIEPSTTDPGKNRQLAHVTQHLRANSEFSGDDWQPTVLQIFWVRHGLPLNPYAVVRFGKPPVGHLD
jgi:4-amino-4-deoxy-L-arabinose transferase-like glycosyltransferase